MSYADPLGLVGVRLGPYVVRELSSVGGVALIYRGEHEALKSAVAVKVLRPELVEDAVRPTLEQMFFREAQILSQLRSEDILRALDHGRVTCPGDGAERPYIVVDWLEGRPLIEDLEERAIARRKYSLPEALELLEPIARALAVCHEAGVVHRDVNPRNVFLENVGPGRTPRAKLIDFGFAKEVARTEALRLHRVDGTLFARSPDYAAPEHYDRDAYGDLSENTDIYTFALMLVQMMTLEPPLRGITDNDLQAATTDPNDRPTPNNRGAHVSPEVERLFHEALAVDQLERPGNLWNFWMRLKAAADPRSRTEDVPAREPQVEAAPVELTEPSEPPRRTGRRRGARVLAAVLGVSIVAIGGVALFRRFRGPEECPPGFADCNGERSDGCEANLRGDAVNCGACRNRCGGGDGALACVDGQCRVAKCAPNLGDCNQTAADGCETDLAADDKNCGACGTVCGAQGAKQARCVASKCQTTCRSGYGDCDGLTENGCEASLASDPKNCGRCSVTCGGDCKDGLCAPAVLASPVAARYLASYRGMLYFWNGDTHAIERIAPDGQRSSVAANVPFVTALAVGGGRVFYATTDQGLFAQSLDANSAPQRISGPLASDTPLVVSASGYVSWANRAARPASERAGRRGAREDVPPPALRRVFSAPLDSVFEKQKPAMIECPTWPGTFLADGSGAYCCDVAKPLARVDCQHGRCTSEPYDALCPENLAMDSSRLYFAQDVRVLSLDPKARTVKALAKRKRRPRELILGAGFLYWLEGEPAADVWRIAADPADGNAPELLAHRQARATALSADETALYFVADAPRGTGNAIYRLPLPSR